MITHVGFGENTRKACKSPAEDCLNIINIYVILILLVSVYSEVIEIFSDENTSTPVRKNREVHVHVI